MRLTILLSLLALSSAACSEDPCLSARSGEELGSGPASLIIRLIEQDGVQANRRSPMTCVDVLVLNAELYADTLAAGRFRLEGEAVRLSGLGTGRVDLVIDLPGYFPAKFTGVELTDGPNLLNDKVLMFSSSTPVAIPGHLGVTLKPDLKLTQVRNIYGPYGKVRVKSAPGNHYELRLPFRGAKGTRKDVETLLGSLVRSPHVLSARPLVEYSAVVRGF